MSSTATGELVRPALEQAERAVHGLVRSADLLAEADPYAVLKFLRVVEHGLYELVDVLEVEAPHLKIVK